jgi:hypothetical protein
LPFLRNLFVAKDGFNWAFWFAAVAVNATFGVDVQHLFAFMKAIARAYYDAVGIFAAKAW